jgi:epoxyqueuosine reductase
VAAVPLLVVLLGDPSPLVRGHAAWALARIMSEDAAPRLKAAYDHEQDADAKAEIYAILS